MKKWLIRQLVKWMTPRLRFIWHDVALWRYVESRGYHVTPVVEVGAAILYACRLKRCALEWHYERHCHPTVGDLSRQR